MSMETKVQTLVQAHADTWAGPPLKRDKFGRPDCRNGHFRVLWCAAADFWQAGERFRSRVKIQNCTMSRNFTIQDGVTLWKGKAG